MPAWSPSRTVSYTHLDVYKRQDHDGGAVLVIVEHGDVQLPLQGLLDLEALGALDVLQIDAAKGCLLYTSRCV